MGLCTRLIKTFGDNSLKKGIYCIINLANRKKYVGSTRSSFKKRCSQHQALLRMNKHHSQHLQNAYNLYGEDNFIFVILKTTDNIVDILKLEQSFIGKIESYYNVCVYAGSPMKGRKHSQQSIEKMSGKTPWNKGINRTEEEKRNISIGRVNALKNKTPEWYTYIANIRKNQKKARYWLGKKLPPHVVDNLKRLAKEISHRIYCEQNKKTYESQLDAAKDLGIKQGHISEHLKGQRQRVASKYTFKKVS